MLINECCLRLLRFCLFNDSHTNSCSLIRSRSNQQCFTLKYVLRVIFALFQTKQRSWLEPSQWLWQSQCSVVEVWQFQVFIFVSKNLYFSFLICREFSNSHLPRILPFGSSGRMSLKNQRNHNKTKRSRSISQLHRQASWPAGNATGVRPAERFQPDSVLRQVLSPDQQLARVLRSDDGGFAPLPGPGRYEAVRSCGRNAAKSRVLDLSKSWGSVC